MPKLKSKDSKPAAVKSSRTSHTLKKSASQSISSSNSAKKARNSFILIKDPEELQAKSSGNQGSGLSRGQRKRQLKKQKVLVKLGKANPLLKNKFSERTDVGESSFSHLLSDLESSLPTADDSYCAVIPAAAAVKTNKMKKQVALRETQRMKLVQQHPAFVENPVAAINNHLQHLIAMRTMGGNHKKPT